MTERKFTQEDYDLVAAEYESLMTLAKKRCRSDVEIPVIREAFEFANSAHLDKRRRSGEPYIIHPISVAKIVVAEMGLGYKSITAALLHDIVDNTDYTVDDIRNLFGEKIASLVEGLSKIKIVLDSEDRKGADIDHEKESARAENLKHILLTLNDDARVVLIKLADRLHNCRTIEYMPEAKRDKILSETMFLFIPLAHRLGLYSIKTEMENIWLRFKEPEAYEELTRKIDKSVRANKDAIDEFIAPISGALRRDDFDFNIKTRIKSPYSVWRKMKVKNIPFEQIYDLYAVRIIFTPSSSDPEIERKQAYMIYADIIGLYKENPGRHRDWIESPKSNGYEALHSTLMSQAGIWIEVQIRSERMDDIAEKGIAAHWTYKRGGYVNEGETGMDRWLSQVQDVLSNTDVDANELLDILHSDLVTSDIVVFTPKGDQVTIPSGATAHDFAYQIHTHIGEKAVAARINRTISPLAQVLKPGDQVEIIISDTAHPYKEWLQYLTTRNARNKVTGYFREDRSGLVSEGEEIYRSSLHAMGLSPSHEYLRRLLEYNQIRDSEEFFFRLGLGLIPSANFSNALSGIDKGTGEDIGKMIISSYSNEVKQYIAADCCRPVPGDPIIGFLSESGRTVLVHKKTCDTAQRLSTALEMKPVTLHWIAKDSVFPVRIRISGVDRMAMINDICSYLSIEKCIQISRMNAEASNGVFRVDMELQMKDRRSLDDILNDIKKIDGIQDVERTEI